MISPWKIGCTQQRFLARLVPCWPLTDLYTFYRGVCQVVPPSPDRNIFSWAAFQGGKLQKLLLEMEETLVKETAGDSLFSFFFKGGVSNSISVEGVIHTDTCYFIFLFSTTKIYVTFVLS